MKAAAPIPSTITAPSAIARFDRGRAAGCLSRFHRLITFRYIGLCSSKITTCARGQTRYCGDNMQRLSQFPDECVDELGLFTAALGLTAPWRVARTEFDAEGARPGVAR